MSVRELRGKGARPELAVVRLTVLGAAFFGNSAAVWCVERGILDYFGLANPFGSLAAIGVLSGALAGGCWAGAWYLHAGRAAPPPRA